MPSTLNCGLETNERIQLNSNLTQSTYFTQYFVVRNAILHNFMRTARLYKALQQQNSAMAILSRAIVSKQPLNSTMDGH
jgi:hypothetical protein